MATQNNQWDIEGVEESESQLTIENFSAKFLDKDIFFQLIHLKDSYFIWIGESNAELDDISIAMFSTSFRSKVVYIFICS